MWTKNSTGMSNSRLPAAHQNFIDDNPNFAAHHFRSTQRVAKSLACYANRTHPSPDDICKLVIKMTSTCNLRCEHCFQWRDSGFHHFIDPTAIPFDECEHLFDFAERTQCDIILNGGEPTVHPDFGKFVDRFAQLGCYVYICTNGLMIRRHMDVFNRHHSQLAFLISIDGIEPVHNAIRGKGTYKKTMDGIRLLSEGKQAGKQWLIGVENTLMAKNLDGALTLLDSVERAGVDWMIFNHLWIASLAARREYDVFCREFEVTPHSYVGFDTGDFSNDYIERVWSAVCELRNCDSKIPLLFGPNFEKETLFAYYKGRLAARPYPKMGVKLDVDIGGKLVLTKQFPDLAFGSVLTQSIESIMASPDYRRAAALLRLGSLRLLNACADTYNFE